MKDPKARERALARYDADPRIQPLRRAAGLAPVTTKRQELTGEARKKAVRETARQVTEANRNAPSVIPVEIRDVGASLIGSANDAMFGLPARAAAVITGTPNDVMQEFANQQGQRNPYTNFLGTIAASIPTGIGAVGAARGTASALSRSAVPAIAQTGRAAQAAGRAASIQRGQRVANTGRVLGAGAAIGTATAAGKGDDLAEGAAFGAGGAAVGAAGIKGAQWIGGKGAEFLRLSGSDAILRRYTNTTREELQRRLDDFRARGRAEPTVYELLDLEDRQNLQKVFGRLPSRQQERGAQLARERVESIPGEVAQVVRNETRGQRRDNIRNLASAQAGSRGNVTPNMDEARLAVGAAENPTRLAQLRRQEARNIMAPFDNRRAVDSVGDLIPTRLEPGKKTGEIVEIPDDPEMAAVIKAAAGSARIRDKEQGLTIREVTGMIQDLKDGLNRATVIERGNIQRAIDHLEDTIATRHPDVAPALARMNERWAARSRQLEGMQEIRKQADVKPNTVRSLQRSENIYETPEGGVGRAMGQRTALIDDLGAGTSAALGKVRQLAESPTEARQIAQNIGVPATRNITEAARAQSESARRLAAAVKDPNANTQEIEAGDLALLAAGLNPSSMAYTKARGVTLLLQRLGKSIPEGRARVMVDMLFSRDPAMTQRAVNALRAQGREGVDALSDVVGIMGGAMAAGGMAEDTAIEMEPAIDPMAAEDDPYAEFSDAVEEDDPYAEFSDEANDPYAEFSEAPLGETAVMSVFPEAEVTDTLRDPNSDLGRKNPRSYHVNSEGAVDVRPIPGVTFEEFKQRLIDEGYEVVEAIDETKNPSGHATGPHWHIVVR
jgi:hypothetical protein